MATQSITAAQYVSTLAVPQPVKLSTPFAADLDEAEQATLPKPIVQVEETTISRAFADQRTLSNASSTSSNATTLVGKEHELEELSPTQSRPFRDDGISTESYLLKISVLIAFSRPPARNYFHQIKKFGFGNQLPASGASE